MHRVTVTALMTGALVLACAAAFPAAAQDYPTRPITMIVPYPPGGGVDVMGRLIGQKLSVALGQQVVIENRGGAGGMIGTRDAAKAAPDGYTIVMLLTGISLGANTGYDVNKDFAPIGIVASTPIIVDANPALPAKSLGDLIALAKNEPGKLAAGTPPAPTINYFAAALFNLMAGTDITVVTYKGTGPLTNDLLGNHVPPAGTPRPIIERLNKELRNILTSDEMRKRLIADGSDPALSTPEEYAANIKREEAKWAALVSKLGLKIE